MTNKINIQVDVDDARIIVACIGFAMGGLTSPVTGLLVMGDKRLLGLYRALLMLLAGGADSRQLDAMMAAGKTAEVLDLVDANMLRLADLMESLLRQTNPEEMADADTIETMARAKASLRRAKP